MAGQAKEDWAQGRLGRVGLVPIFATAWTILVEIGGVMPWSLQFALVGAKCCSSRLKGCVGLGLGVFC